MLDFQLKDMLACADYVALPEDGSYETISRQELADFPWEEVGRTDIAKHQPYCTIVSAKLKRWEEELGEYPDEDDYMTFRAVSDAIRSGFILGYILRVSVDGKRREIPIPADDWNARFKTSLPHLHGEVCSWQDVADVSGLPEVTEAIYIDGLCINTIAFVAGELNGNVVELVHRYVVI